MRLKVAGIFFFFALAATVACSAQTLRVGYFIAESTSMSDASGSAYGSNIEYFRQVAARMRVSVVFFEYPFKRLLSALEDGSVDAVLQIGKYPEREKLFTYPAKSFFATNPCLVVNSDSRVKKVKSADDVRGLRIADTGGEAQIKLLASRRVDAVYSPDARVISYYIQKYGDESSMSILLPDAPVEWYTVFAKKMDPGLIARYETALTAQQADFPFDLFYREWLNTYRKK